jgi:hypothetical protein
MLAYELTVKTDLNKYSQFYIYADNTLLFPHKGICDGYIRWIKKPKQLIKNAPLSDVTFEALDNFAHNRIFVYKNGKPKYAISMFYNDWAYTYPLVGCILVHGDKLRRIYENESDIKV